MYHNLFLFLGVKRTLYHTGDGPFYLHWQHLSQDQHDPSPKSKTENLPPLCHHLLPVMCLQGISYHPPLEDSSQMSVNQK